MKRMRSRIILLVFWLTLLFNIERVDIDQQSPFNLAWFVYILAAATVGIFLVVPMRRREMYLVSFGVLAAYGALKWYSLSPFLRGGNKYVTLTEIGALLITIAVTWAISEAIHDFVQAVEAISLPEGRRRLLAYEQIQERIHTEISGARRHQRPLSIALIELDPTTFEAALHQAVRDAQAMMIERYVRVRFGLFLSRHIRGTDVIAHSADRGRFLLLAADTPGDQTAEMLARLSHLVEGEMGLRFRYSIADFPNTALTSEELIRRAAEALQYAPAGDASDQDGVQLERTVAASGADGRSTVPVAPESGLDERR